MTREELRVQLAAWLLELVDDVPPRLPDEVDLVGDLGLDSLALAELASKLRRASGVQLEPGKPREHVTVGAVLDLVQARLAAP